MFVRAALAGLLTVLLVAFPASAAPASRGLPGSRTPRDAPDMPEELGFGGVPR